MANVSVVPKRGYYRVARGELVAYVERGYVLVPCGGAAHQPGDRQLDSCCLCADGPWAWRAVKRQDARRARGRGRAAMSSDCGPDAESRGTFRTTTPIDDFEMARSSGKSLMFSIERRRE